MKTTIILKADKEVKKKAQNIAKEMGLPLSTVINAYLREFIRNQKVTFSLEPQLRPQIVQLLKEASIDYQKGKNISPVFRSAEEMDEYLDTL